tara:strand:+ start:219 stop:614 length:396 start_codon:yes stop_codon:yes gene_type:complete
MPKILVVEDTMMAAEVLCMVLENLGCAADHVEDGAQALEILCMDSEMYSLVLMDLRMPVMDGFEATRAIRKMGCVGIDGLDLPVIAVTADETFDTRSRCCEIGFEDFATKPLLPVTLAGLLKKYINHDVPG